jgi:CheY-like chemotaxis protein
MLATNTTRIYKSSIALTPFLEELHLKYTEICFDKDLKVNLIIPENANNITISCDASLIRKTFQHLLNNAVKFTPSGSINFGYTIQHDAIEFFVKDTGSGIEKEALDLVFKYFMQENTATTRGHEGSGLGLSIAKGFVELMGGHIRCTSTKNKGSDFFFTIPLPQDLRDINNNRIPKIRYPDNSLIKIIVAEDDPDNYYYLSTLLKLHTDSIVFHAKTGYEVLQLLAEHPDTVLIFMDLKMPKMDGLEATKKIRASGFKDLFIIAITAHAGNEDIHNAIEAGCDNYITKPVNAETITNLLRNIGIKTKPLSGKS